MPKQKTPTQEAGAFIVGSQSFVALGDAAKEASRASEGGKRIQITTLVKKPIQGGYGGQSKVVASFFDGIDLDSVAADEDGNPDLAVRAKALVRRQSNEKPRFRRIQ